MLVTFSTADGQVCALDVDASEKLDDVRALLEVHLRMPMHEQQLVLNGRALTDLSASLSSAGVGQNDLIMVLRVPSASASGAPRSAAHASGARRASAGPRGLPRRPVLDPAFYSSMTWDDLPDVDSNTLHAILRVNSGMMAHIAKHDPAMHAAAAQSDPSKLRALIMTRQLDAAIPDAERKMRLAQMEARLAKDPFDEEAQRVLEEEITRKNVEENRNMALEHMPESFARVHMLYINAAINGVPVKVFVDSGAQSTILSKRCAERCNLLRLLDVHFSGQAVGVGTARILGRVHVAPLVIGKHHFPCTFTVLDQNDMDCLLGLDMLKRFQCCIDLFRNVLRLRLETTEVEVPFLGEGDAPKGILGGDGERMDEDAPEKGAAAAAAPPATASAPAAAPVPAPAPSVHVGASPRRSPAAGPAAAGTSMFAPIDLTGLAVAPAADDAKVQTLMQMGYTRDKCVQALMMANGLLDGAAALLPDL